MMLQVMFLYISCSLQQKISHHRYWPLEIIRTIQPAGAKVKGREDESFSSYHGIAYVDLAPLLYPGVSKVRGAYLIHPYNEADAHEKLHRKGILNEEVMKAIIGINRSISSFGQPKLAPTKQGKAEAKAKVIVLSNVFVPVNLWSKHLKDCHHLIFQ